MLRPPLSSTLFPYTTLFRSDRGGCPVALDLIDQIAILKNSPQKRIKGLLNRGPAGVGARVSALGAMCVFLGAQSAALRAEKTQCRPLPLLLKIHSLPIFAHKHSPIRRQRGKKVSPAVFFWGCASLSSGAYHNDFCSVYKVLQGFCWRVSWLVLVRYE